MFPRRRPHAGPNRDAAPVASAPHLPRAGLLLSAITLAAIGYATLMPAAQAPVTAPLCLVCGDRGGVDAILNFLLFVPLGAGLLLAGLPARRAIVLMSLLSATIEATQGLAIPGRDASIGDLLFNTLGGAAGFALFARARVILQPSPREAARLTATWCGVWLAVQLMVSYALSPGLPRTPWFLQVGRKLPGHEQFPGSVASVSIGSRTLHDGPLAGSSAGARSDLLSATPLVVAIHPAGATRRTAPIVHLVDRDRRGILLLAQRGSSLLFTMRTGADRLRIRPPMIELHDVLVPANDEQHRDALTVTARREADALVMSAQRDGRRNEIRVPLYTSLGWTLVFPAQWRLTNAVTERLLSFTWFAALLLPLGWWWRATRGDTLFVFTTTVAGLVLIPRIFGLPSAPYEWVAAVFGLASGNALATAYARRRKRLQSQPMLVDRQPHTAAASRHESATA